MRQKTTHVAGGQGNHVIMTVKLKVSATASPKCMPMSPYLAARASEQRCDKTTEIQAKQQRGNAHFCWMPRTYEMGIPIAQ